MELIRGIHNLKPHHRGCVATIGAFDGIHHGHRAVLQQLLDKGKELGLPTVVIVFEPLPSEYFSPLEAPARLTSFRERFVALQDYAIDRLFRIRFTAELSRLNAETFIEKIFVKGLGVRYMVVGDDLRFGYRREGDYHLLKSAGQKEGFEVVATSTFTEKGQRVSSTRIRQALETADFKLAERLLGRPYTISGKVMVGRRLGRTLGSPTANLQLNRLKTALSGVYAVEVSGLGERLIPGVANVGTRPTVDDKIKAMLEVHLLNFDEDIYGKHINVVFRHKIREEKKFSSLEELKTNIHVDIQFGKEYFGIS